jgi:phage-related minor tail protein
MFNHDLEEAHKAKLDKMTSYSDQAARNMQDAFANFLFDPFKEGLDGMLRGFIDIIRRMIAEAAAAELLGAFQSSTGGIMNFLGLGKRAAGGPVSAGKPYMVGEKGPELFVPGSSGGIVPNHKMGGGGGVNVTVNIDARNATDPAALLSAAQLVRRQLKSDMATYTRRGYMPA